MHVSSALRALGPAGWFGVGAALLVGNALRFANGSPVPPSPVSALAEHSDHDAGSTLTDASPPALRPRHLERLGVVRWHKLGLRGQGVAVAILDSGFRGYGEHLGHALPNKLRVHSFRDDGNLEAKNSQHGILCAEVLHTLAPEAQLLVANWEQDRPDRFLDAVRWARREGARIISCSIIMPSWSDGEGGGAFHRELANLLGDGSKPDHALFFASAGNIATRHWHGAFAPNADGWHQWRPAQIDNPLEPWGRDRVSVELYGAVGSTYDVLVLDGDTGEQHGKTTARCGPDRCTTIVQFLPASRTRYVVRVKRTSGPGGPFHLVVLGGSLGTTTAKGSIACPADGERVVAVGAVDWSGERAGYSSCGPNSRSPKPDFVAPIPFPSAWRSQPFAGTSAAAPQAAALAALCWSRHPDWTPNQVREALVTAALDLNEPGHDHETGFGQIRLPNLD